MSTIRRSAQHRGSGIQFLGWVGWRERPLATPWLSANVEVGTHNAMAEEAKRPRRMGDLVARVKAVLRSNGMGQKPEPASPQPPPEVPPQPDPPPPGPAP